MSINVKALATATLPVILVAACSGGGSGNTGGTNERQFTTFDNLLRNGTTIVNGEAFTADVTSNNTGLDESNRSGPSDATTRIYQENGGLVALSVSGSGSSASIDERNGGTFTIDGDFVEGVSGDGENQTIFGDPETLGFNHQTFGVWIDGDPTSSASYGTGNFGNRTGNRPSSNNTANYSGKSIGVYTTANSSQSGIVKGSANVSTDFSTASVSITNNRLNSFNGNINNQLRNDLNLSGTLAVNNDGTLNGAISGPATTGTASGSFYGGNAQEVGGTFVTTGNNGSVNYNGSFGAKR